MNTESNIVSIAGRRRRGRPPGNAEGQIDALVHIDLAIEENVCVIQRHAVIDVRLRAARRALAPRATLSHLPPQPGGDAA